MTQFTADIFYAVPNQYSGPLFALNIRNLLEADAPDPMALLFHPQVNFDLGLIINRFVADALDAKEGDKLRLTILGRSGGTFNLPAWTIGAVTEFDPGAPYLNVSADLLRPHFDFTPDEVYFNDYFVTVLVHGKLGVCSMPRAGFP